MISDTDRAYAAGLLDGEGCVSIVRYKRKVHDQLVLRITVVNSYLPALEWLKDRWGGYIVAKPLQENRKPTFAWAVAAKLAATFIADTRPFLRIKHAQADNALAFQATKRIGLALTAKQWAEAETYLATQHDLNRRGAVGGQ